MEDGVFAGQGQLPLIHAGDRRLAPYGQDHELQVSERIAEEPPFALTRLVIANGVLTGDHRSFRDREYTIENPGPTPRTVVLGVRQSDNNGAGAGGPWELDTPPMETLGSEPTSKLYRFAVQVEPHSTQVFKVREGKTHPIRTPIEQLTIENIGGIIHESNNNPQVIAQLQPIADAKKRLADLDAQIRDRQKEIDEVNAEEARLRQNIATLKGTTEEKPLAKHYADAMLEQENKLSDLRRQQEADRQLRQSTQKLLTNQIQTLDTDLKFPLT
jgi:hypothetical protein